MGVAFAVMILGSILAGCGGTALPSFDEARTETEQALARVVSELPADARVSKKDLSFPYPCDKGVMFATRWTVYPGPDFDVNAFIDDLPALLGDEAETQESIVQNEDAGVWLKLTDSPASGVGVSNDSSASEPAVGLLGFSRCAEEPAS